MQEVQANDVSKCLCVGLLVGHEAGHALAALATSVHHSHWVHAWCTAKRPTWGAYACPAGERLEGSTVVSPLRFVFCGESAASAKC